MPTKRRRGRAAEHAEVVLPIEYVQTELFGFTSRGSVRKLMSRRGVRAVTGYRYEDVERVYSEWDPDRAWDRSPQFEPDEEYE